MSTVGRGGRPRAGATRGVGHQGRAGEWSWSAVIGAESALVSRCRRGAVPGPSVSVKGGATATWVVGRPGGRHMVRRAPGVVGTWRPEPR